MKKIILITAFMFLLFVSHSYVVDGRHLLRKKRGKEHFDKSDAVVAQPMPSPSVMFYVKDDTDTFKGKVKIRTGSGKTKRG